MKKVVLGWVCVLTMLSGVWASEVVVVDQLVAIREKEDVQSAGKKMTLVGPRNGVCSGSVVVLGLAKKAVISDLFFGTHKIESKNITIRYAAKDPNLKLRNIKSTSMFNVEKSDPLAQIPYYDVLKPKPSKGNGVHPVWVTVRVPKETPRGLYRGILSVGAEKIPVELTVSRYVVPDPNDWEAHAGIDSAPETLALYYNVPEWSSEHWKLIEQEFEFLGGLGDDELLVPVIPSQERKPGGYCHFKSWIDFSDPMNPDFSIVDKYISLYVEKNGIPKFLILDVWRPYYDESVTKASNEKTKKKKKKKKSASNSAPVADASLAKKKNKKPKAVTKIVNQDGTSIPYWNTKQADSEPIWTAIFDGILAICEKNGIPKESILLGIATDARPIEETAAFFKKIAPYAKWQIWTHGRGDSFTEMEECILDNYLDIGLYVHPYVPNPDYSKPGIAWGPWELPFPNISSAARNGIYANAPLSHWRSLSSGLSISHHSVLGHYGGNGVAHLNLDVWDLDYPSYVGYFSFLTLTRNNSRYIIAPGDEGPLGTIRYEMLREGMQELEARIILERAIKTETLSRKNKEEVETFMKSYFAALYSDQTFNGGHYGGTLGAEGTLFGVSDDWKKTTARLFELAGKIQH